MANFTPNQNDYKNLTPFKTWLLLQINTWGQNNFPFVESDFDELTNYGMMQKLMKALNDVISNENMVEEDMTNLYNAFTELQTYLFEEFADYKSELNASFDEYKEQVDGEVEQFETTITADFNTLHDFVYNYFNNLDVQQEIDNKLDDMVESGTLQEIIADYLNSKALFGYDNVASMKQATNLIDGSYAETLGYYSKNDGGSSLYKIRQKTNEDVTNEENLIALNDNTLVAELIIKNGILNVKQFGAKGDNVTEDSTIIQHAIIYAQANDYSIYIPSGRYKISTTLNVTGCSIKGDSTTNTILVLNNCDGLSLKQFNKDNICVIENIAFGSQNVNVEIAGISYQRYENGSNIRSRGYHLTNLYFYGLGCGIEIQDAFNNMIDHIRMNDCFRCLYLKNQVVQCTFNNITANYDLDDSITSTRFGETINQQHSIGVEIGLKGETERPEGIKMIQVCCTNYNIGCYHRDSLYFYASQCEFDLSRERALYVGSGQGGTTFDGCWFANRRTSTSPIVEFGSASTTDKYYKALINCTIFNQSEQSNVIGIGVGNNYPYGWNMNIINCNVSNSVNCQLKYGIQLNRCRSCTLENNSVYGCETDIKVDVDGKNQILNNRCDTIDVTSYAGTTVYALNNIYRSGVTIWNNHTNFGDYSVSNNIT